MSLASQYRIAGRHCHAQLFYMDAGIQTEVLMFKWQVLYQLGHFSSLCYTVKELKIKHLLQIKEQRKEKPWQVSHLSQC